MEANYLKSLDIPGRIIRHPYQSLLIAAGVGYILGGGLFSRLTVNVLRLGVRVGGLPMVQRQLLGVAEAAFSPSVGAQASPQNGHSSQTSQS